MTTQTEYNISTVVYSGDLMPDGDGYAPQIVLTAGYRGQLNNVTELNTQDLPFTAEEFVTIWERFNDQVTLARWISIFHGKEIFVHRQDTTGYSQGDWGESFVFGTPEYFATTGATQVTESDHNDLCAWVWGDVYEVCTKAVTHEETCNLGHVHTITDGESEPGHIIYGMDEAMKFAKEHNIEIEGL